MIRRNPTLIPLSDADVQEVRDIVAKQRGEVTNPQLWWLRYKALLENPSLATNSKEDLEILERIKKDKAARLGLRTAAKPPASMPAPIEEP